MFKKISYILIGIVCMPCLYAAELPMDYYQKADGKSDEALKEALREIIIVGERYKYGSQSDASVNLYTWNAFCLTDARPDGTIWDMYSPYRHHFTYHNRGASGMAIEHSFPKSWWGWNITEDETDFAYRDLYHLNPSEHRANGKKRDNMPGEIVGTPTFDNGVFRLGKMQNGKTVFEPADCYKGDFARAYFYVVTCYGDYTWLTTGPAADAMTNASYLEFQPWLQEILLKWHREDPVSAKELHRQDVISTIQKNRNPYIDYPELVEYIWGDKAGTAVQFASLAYTGSDTYVPPIDTQNAVATPPTDVRCNRFTANWQDAGAENYTLQVFAQDTVGKPDTLINMQGLKATWINANEYMSWNGTNSTSDGTAGMTMGSTSADYTITISGLTIPENTVLVVRANISKYENTEASLLITADGATVQNIALNFNETYYTIPLPKGAKNIVLAQGKSKKRVSIQQLFLIQNPLVITRKNVQTYTTTALEYEVALGAQPTERLYYTITPKHLSESNLIPVDCYLAECQETSLPQVQQARVKRVGNMVYLTNVPQGARIQLYDVTGKRVIETGDEVQTIQLPQRGLYLLRIGTQTLKINY